MSTYIIGVDIGGTTYSSVLFDEDIHIIKKSEKKLIEKINNTNHLLESLVKQINSLIDSNISGNVLGVGISLPGPLSVEKGIVLDTPNLKFLQNIKIKEEIENRCNLSVYIENDANLFSFGEWYINRNSKNDIFGGITLGTGFGFGLIFNGQIYSGAHGLATEYAISPIDGGNWENKISKSALINKSLNLYKDKFEPKVLCEMASKGEERAIKIWNEFGNDLGMAVSHFINMIDPSKIAIGGGISNAFNLFESSMIETLNKYSVSYKKNKIEIYESKEKELSSQIGAALLVKHYQ